MSKGVSIKCVIVGEQVVGKTCLLYAFDKADLPEGMNNSLTLF